MRKKEETKLVAIRRPVSVGRPQGRVKMKMIPYGKAYADKVEHSAVVNGLLMMEVPVTRDETKRQAKFLKGEYRGLKKGTK